MMDDLDRSIAQSAMSPETARQSLLGIEALGVGEKTSVEWSPNDVTVHPIHRAVEAHARHQPDAIALLFQDKRLTYAALDQQANQLSHYLHQWGVGPGVAVAVCVEPSLDIGIALLGVLKAGGVYVPLDPTYPAERLTALLEETQAQVVLTQSWLLSHLPTGGAHVCCFDRDGNILHAFPTHAPACDISLDQTAYLIYTSGTTGKPKGVMVSHRNLSHYIQAAQSRFGFNRHDVMPAIARFTFSITFFELLSPLVAGGTLLILEREHILDFARMVRTLEQVTVVHTSPSLMRKLLAHIQEHPQDSPRLHNIRHASCGGDRVPPDLLETMKAVFQTAEIFVIYGCSEISCMGCAYPVPRDRAVVGTRVGQPFPQVSVHLYDTQQGLQEDQEPQPHQVPLGTIGEIYIGGRGIAQGYLDREDLTQERFVTIAGERFYRTGDLGRWDQDGQLEMLGRNDFQIKLRGIRIEPGEIEVTLRQDPGVREAIVVAPELRPGEPALVAYVVLDPQHPANLDSLRSFLQSKLPDYMVPAIFVPLETLPLTLNGKLDRQALPLPTPALRADRPASSPPSTELERHIAAIWSDILGIESIGIEDDFFALGGHSLLATQVIYRLRAALKLDLAISRLFEYPTIAQLAAYLEPLCQVQVNQSAAADARFQALVPTENRGDTPLSTTQSNLWFLSQLEEGRTLNIPLAFRLGGSLDIGALERSLSEIVRRHETLRTIFPVANAVPVQRVLPAQPVHLFIEDLQPLPEGDRWAQTYQLAQGEAQHVFNLTTDLPLRVTLVRWDATAHVLLVTIHHIAADGWSLGVFWQELTALYAAFLQGEPSPLPDLPVQYRDFVQWQQQWLMPDWLNPQLDYWQRQLAGAPSLLELPTDRPRPPVQTFKGGTAFFTLDATLTQQLKALSQRHGSTLFMTLLAGWAILLSRYRGQRDLVIGSPIANRSRSELEPLIGFFINVLALRLDLSGNPDFLDLLQRVRQVALESYTHQDVPFGQVVETVLSERNRGISPLFQVMFILQNSPSEALQLSGLTVAPLAIESVSSQYDLRLMMDETPDGLNGAFEYNRDLFDPATIVRMVSHFQTLLQAIVAEPTQSITALPLLSPNEQQQMVQLGCNPDPAVDLTLCIHEVFEAQVARTPEAIALIAETHHLTYREMNQRANQLARHLQTLGVGPDVLVAIVLERSVDLLISIFAVLKAGGAYVPIDPAYPSERQKYQLTNSQARVILTQQSLVETLPQTAGQMIALESCRDRLDAYSSDNLLLQTTPQNLAYVIYTSGSTGNPKGVMVMHQGVVNHSRASVRAFQLTPGDRMLQFSSIGFDIFVEEVFPTLTQGATLVLRSEEITQSIRAFGDFVQRHRITILDIPTAFWHEWVNGLVLLQESVPASLRLVVVGGEKASQSVYQQWLSLAPAHVRWLNTYGPTEATVTTTLFDPQQSDLDKNADIPIGRAIANLETYILDESLQPVPIGIPGELHIGGMGLAKGYLNLPAQNQEKFIPHPFSSDPAARLYKTGDIASYLPDGNIAFGGRRDYQVKIRGFRIELGEIETCLEQHPAVQQAVVLVREDSPNTKSLAAYVVSGDRSTLTAEDLHPFLQAKLPAYMLPAAYLILDSFPLTANGKVDRRALPAPTGRREDRADTAVPADALERQLLQIWQEVLGVRSLSINDDFFECGGHSLLSLQLFARIEQTLGLALAPTQIFQTSTVKLLASWLRQSSPASGSASAIAIQVGNPSLPPLFCIHVLGPNCQFFRPLVSELSPEQPVYGLAAQMVDRDNAPSNRIPDLAAYYIREMQRLQPHGPYYLAGVSFGGCVAFEMACQLAAQGEPVALLALLDTFAPHRGDATASIERVSAHLDRLRQIGPLYVLRRLKAKLMRLRDKALVRYGQWRERAGYPVSYTIKFLMVLEENRHAVTTYTPGVYAGVITLFRAQENVFYSRSYLDSGLGWRDLTQAGLEIHDVPGDHMRMLEQPNVQVLAQQLRAYLP